MTVPSPRPPKPPRKKPAAPPPPSAVPASKDADAPNAEIGAHERRRRPEAPSGFPVVKCVVLGVLLLSAFLAYRWIRGLVAGGVESSPWGEMFEACQFDNSLAHAGDDSPGGDVVERRKRQVAWEKKRLETPMPGMKEERALKIDFKDRVLDAARGNTLGLLVEIRNERKETVAFDPRNFYVRGRPTDRRANDDPKKIRFSRTASSEMVPASSLAPGEGVAGALFFPNMEATLAMDLIYNDGDIYQCDLIGTEAYLRQASLSKLTGEWASKKLPAK